MVNIIYYITWKPIKFILEIVKTLATTKVIIFQLAVNPNLKQ